MDFPIESIQVDGGSEFMAEFKDYCEEMGIKFYVLPPRSPKRNGFVERANETYRYEFWNVYEIPDTIDMYKSDYNRGTGEATCFYCQFLYFDFFC